MRVGGALLQRNQLWQHFADPHLYPTTHLYQVVFYLLLGLIAYAKLGSHFDVR